MPVRVYDYQNSKTPLMLGLAENVLEKEVPGNYFLDTDWLKGPSILITLREKESEERLADQVKQYVEHYKNENSVDPVVIETIKRKYEKEQKRLIDLELRTAENIEMKDDGVVEIGEGKSGVYNSEYHRQLFHRFRFLSQPVNNKLLKEISDMNEKERTKLFTEMFLYIATLFNGNITQGYISYLSHVMGFFSRLKLEGHDENVKERFDDLYNKLFKEEVINYTQETKSALSEWKEVWKTISDDMRADFKKEKFIDDKNLDLNIQYQMFKKHISKMDNPFHNLLLEKGDLEALMMSDEMIIYRNIINLFYITLPFFEQGMLKKHFYGYCAIKHVEENYSNLLMKI
ncbi:hypothetical protein ACE41A_10360 [Bacillus cytotoxicus]|uniref:hypothetical protein n=1 Tax=Bacillus cytotoxicus TaxID=580165 RepID=UPI0035CB0591